MANYYLIIIQTPPKSSKTKKLVVTLQGIKIVLKQQDPISRLENNRKGKIN